MGRLDDRVALITGGARGQGEPRLFHSEGAGVVVADVLEEQGKALEQEPGNRALFVRLDARHEEDWQYAVAVTFESFASLDVLVNNAGILECAPVLEVSLDDSMAVVEVNLASDESAFCTGSSFAADGGAMAGGMIQSSDA